MHFGINEILFLKSFWLISASSILISVSGYIINDYFDVKIDQINKPNEVYVGRIISRRQALFLHQFLNVIALTLGYFCGLKILLINALSIFLLWFYASIFKKKTFWGNFIVAFLLALVLLELAWFYQPFNKLVYAFALYVFFTNLVREIIKDIEDMEGDAVHGSLSLPIKLGLVATKKTIYVIIVILMILSLIAALWSQLNVLWVIFGLFILFFTLFIVYLKRADRKIHFKNMSLALKLLLILGLLCPVIF